MIFWPARVGHFDVQHKLFFGTSNVLCYTCHWNSLLGSGFRSPSWVWLMAARLAYLSIFTHIWINSHRFLFNHAWNITWLYLVYEPIHLLWGRRLFVFGLSFAFMRYFGLGWKRKSNFTGCQRWLGAAPLPNWPPAGSVVWAPVTTFVATYQTHKPLTFSFNYYFDVFHHVILRILVIHYTNLYCIYTSSSCHDLTALFTLTQMDIGNGK